MDLSYCKHLRFFGLYLNSVACKWLALVITAVVVGAISISTFSGFDGGVEQRRDILLIPLNSRIPDGKSKFLEVPQIIWGLNNQKIALVRAILTARMMNRTLLMPSLSASLFYKEVDLLQPIPFGKVFQFGKFNSLCKGFAQVSSYSDVTSHSDVFELQKGSGRRWTIEKDLDQLREFTKHPYDKYEIVRIVGKNPFLWHDHWPVSDYAKVFECLVFVDEILKEAEKVVSKIREVGFQINHKVGVPQNDLPYLAVHMRIEKDWMIHCKKLELRYNITEICSSKEQIIKRVGNIKGLANPTIVYLAVADSLLEDNSIMNGWTENLHPFEKKKLGVVDIYKKHTYLIQSAIDYEVCSRSDVFVGNSFSTFSSLVVLDRTQTMINLGVPKLCGTGVPLASYAYNLQGDQEGPRPWATNMSETSLQSISYGSNHISC